MKKNILKIQIGLIAAILLYLYWPVFVWMIGEWENNANYGHGYFVPLACIYLIFRKKTLLKNMPSNTSSKGVIVILFGLILYLFGNRIEFMQISLFSFLVVIFGLLLFYLGKEKNKELLFPIGYFIFGIPMPYYLESFTVPLKTMASIVSTGILKTLGYMVAREGNIIYMPNYTLEVATACSGLKSLVLVTAVGALYAYITQNTLRRKWILFICSIPIAVAANIARIVVVAMLASFFGQSIAFRFVHDFSGIFVFIVAGALLALTGVLIEWIAKRRLG